MLYTIYTIQILLLLPPHAGSSPEPADGAGQPHRLLSMIVKRHQGVQLVLVQRQDLLAQAQD